MKYIRNISDEQNKVGDTDNVFRLNLFEDDKLFDFGENNLTVNIANSSGYILSLTPKKETGNTVIDLDFNDTPLKSLTPDDYLLEVEVKFSDGTTATFPTKDGMPFTVNGNLKETSGKLVPTVTFDNVLDAVDKKIAVYMDTVKVGPVGPKGPAGNVDTSNDNTFTGVNKFTQLIDGYTKTRVSPNTNLDLIKTSGKYELLTASTYTNVPSGMPNNAILIVENSVDNGTTYQYIFSRDPVNQNTDMTIFFRVNVSNTWSTWRQVAKDSAAVHVIGTETIAGNKTFSSPISGRFLSKDSDVTDFNDIAKTMYAHAGIVNVRGTALANSPEPGMTWYTVVVNPSIANDAGSMVAYANDKMFYTGVGSGVIQGWVKVSNDSNVVHKTGTETINGDKTFRSGSYGLRVTTAGIQKTSDNGVTWTNI